MYNFKKSIFSAVLLGITLLGGNNISTAAPISPEAAAIEAAAFLNSNPGSGIIMRAPATASSLKLAKTEAKNHQPLYYVFNHDQGFIIVSADSRFKSILGYSDAGRFDENNIPPNMKDWLAGYSEEISHFMRIIPEDNGTAGVVQKASKNRTPITPLLTTKWDQGTPYNLLCPDDAYGQKCVTGCVATAYAQIMNFHEWPRNPVGSCGGVDFNGTYYSWRNMLDEYVGGNYTSTQATAVATLMRQCGAAVNMNYSAWISGAYSSSVQVALPKYFKYAPDLQMLWRDYIPQKEWDSIIYSELQAGRPVYYSGVSSQGGHAFVCDGYSQNDYFHFNWGWGGYEDGYFLLSALNPATGGYGSYEGGYTSQQSIIINIRPGTESAEPKQATLLSSGSFCYSSGNNYEIRDNEDGTNVIYNPLGYTITVEVALKITSVDNSSFEPQYVNCGSSTELESFYGFSGLSSAALPKLQDGTYKVIPVFRSPGLMEDWQPIAIPLGKQSYVNLNVSNGKNTLSNPGPDKDSVAKLIFGEPEFCSNVYGNIPIAVRIPVVNVGKGDFFGNLSISLTNIDDDFANAGSEYYYYSIPAETSRNIDVTFTEVLTPGRYQLSIMDLDGNEYTDTKIVNITDLNVDQPTGNLTISNISPNFITAGQLYPINLTIENSQLYSSDINIEFEVLNYDNMSRIKKLPVSATFKIPGNSSERYVINSFDYDLQPGRYMLRAITPEGAPLSMPTPVIVNSPIIEKDGISYIITSETDRKAVLVAPLGDSYTGNVIVPASIDGYEISTVRNDAFTFSNTEFVSLPSTITSLSPGTFYSNSKLNQLELQSAIIIPYRPLIFSQDKEGEIWLILPSSILNTWMATEGWNNFRAPYWNIKTEGGVEIINGLELNPDTNLPYSPYFVRYDSPLTMNLKAPEGMNIKVVTVLNGEWIMHQVIAPSTPLNLPAPGRFSSGRVTLSATNENVSVGVVEAENEKFNIFTIDGRIVARDADKSAIPSLQPGVYIIAGKKVLIK